MEQINLIIAKNLKIYREDKKLSLERVAELTGVSKTMIGQIERGESSPTITTIWKIANGLKISFTSLINDPQPDANIILKALRFKNCLKTMGSTVFILHFHFEPIDALRFIQSR